MKNVAIILAGGSGTRLSANFPKQYINISGKTILRAAIEKFLYHKDIDLVQVVIGAGHESYYRSATDGLNLPNFVLGGESRQKSVQNGLEALKRFNPKNVLIHDAARPFVTQGIISKIIEKLNDFKAVDLGVTPKDTVKRKDQNESLEVLNRQNLYCTQTPQGFDYQTIHKLHQKYQNLSETDDISLAIMGSVDVGFVEGDYSNIKITTQEDLKMNSVTKVGFGYDVHKFDLSDKGNHMVPICGIKVQHDYKVIAHSDGDVGLHALMDAMLGSAGLGDIGEHFPPSDNKWKNADSMELLKHVDQLVKSQGGQINNIDVTIICEAPKLTRYKNEMKKVVAQTLKIDENLVNIKATTTEKLGFTGRGEGIAAQAVCSISY